VSMNFLSLLLSNSQYSSFLTLLFSTPLSPSLHPLWGRKSNMTFVFVQTFRKILI